MQLNKRHPWERNLVQAEAVSARNPFPSTADVRVKQSLTNKTSERDIGIIIFSLLGAVVLLALIVLIVPEGTGLVVGLLGGLFMAAMLAFLLSDTKISTPSAEFFEGPKSDWMAKTDSYATTETHSLNSW